MSYSLLLLLLFGHFATAHLGFGNNENLNLACNCDFETIFCQFEAENCSDYNLTIENDYYYKECSPQQCNSDKCCCSEVFSTIINEKFTATVWTESKAAEVKMFNTTMSFKPPTPTLVSVVESNGNVEVKWKSNMVMNLSHYIKAEVTFYKKGGTKKVSKPFVPAVAKDLQYYPISGHELDPATTYWIRVRSFAGWNEKFSDSSNELLITTSGSSDSLVLALILGLSVFAALLCGTIFYCYKKAKRDWWDKYSEPKVTVTHLKVPMVLTPVPLQLSVCVTEEEELSKKQEATAITDDQRMSSEVPVAVQNILELLPLLKESLSHSLSQGTGGEQGSGSSDILNHTYSLLFPNCSGQKTEMLSDSACSSNTSDIVNDPNRLACLLSALQHSSSLRPTNMSYHPSTADPPRRDSHADSSIFSSTNMTPSGPLKSIVEGNFEMSCGTPVKLANPFYSCVPTGSHQFLTVKDGYQPVPSKIELSDALHSEKPSGYLTHVLNKCPGETFPKIPQPGFNPFTHGLINNTLNSQFYPELLADNTLKVISDYHSV